MASKFTPFPILDEIPEQAEWPSPPFAWRHLRPPANDVAQPCRIEVDDGKSISGEMTGFDPVARTLLFRPTPNSRSTTLSFARFRRLTLTHPLQPAPQIAGAPAERIPAAAQKRDYRLESAGLVRLNTERRATM